MQVSDPGSRCSGVPVEIYVLKVIITLNRFIPTQLFFVISNKVKIKKAVCRSTTVFNIIIILIFQKFGFLEAYIEIYLSWISPHRGWGIWVLFLLRMK